MLAVIERHKAVNGRGDESVQECFQRKLRLDLLEHYIEPHLYNPGSCYVYTQISTRGFGQEPAIGVEHVLERLIHWIA